MWVHFISKQLQSDLYYMQNTPQFVIWQSSTELNAEGGLNQNMHFNAKYMLQLEIKRVIKVTKIPEWVTRVAIELHLVWRMEHDLRCAIIRSRRHFICFAALKFRFLWFFMYFKVERENNFDTLMTVCINGFKLFRGKRYDMRVKLQYSSQKFVILFTTMHAIRFRLKVNDGI